MVSKSIPAKAGVESGDLLTEKFRASMLRLESLRTEKRGLADQIKSVEATSLQPESRTAVHSAAQESREHAARCLKLAEGANFHKLREFFLAEADGWLRLAEQQEQREKGPLKTAMNLPAS